MQPKLTDLKSLITDIAKQDILPFFANVPSEWKTDGSIVTQVDVNVQNKLKTLLSQRWPNYQFLGEEMPKSEQHALLNSDHPGLWCLDPLDGTRNFTLGLPFFAISLGLIINAEVVLGIVYDPIRDECFMAKKGQGAWLNQTRLPPKQFAVKIKQCTAVVDYKRLPSRLASNLAKHPPYSSQRSFGSVALDWCWLAAGRYHLYLHGCQKLWDYAAGSLILKEAGGLAMTLEQQAISLSHLKGCSTVATLDPVLFEQWQTWILAHL